MGVLTDYFRAADAGAVIAAMDGRDGGPLVAVPQPAFDGVDAKGVDSGVVLGELIAIIRSVPWRVDLVDQTVVWPTTPAPGPAGPTGDDDPWATGPWVTELADAVRDTLAAVPDAEVPKLAEQWAHSEELEGALPEHLQPLAQALIELARRARDAEQRLYCWTSL